MKRTLFALALSVGGLAQAAPTVPQERLQALAFDPYWIALNHYETGKLGGWRSYVDDPRFFLAEAGEHHPDAELAATLKALYAPPGSGDQHAQCVYPARTRWLREKLQLTDLPHVDCAEFSAWFKDIAPHSAVLISRQRTSTAPRRCSATPCCASTRPTSTATTPPCSATR